MILKNRNKQIECIGIGFDDSEYVVRYIYGILQNGNRVYFEQYNSTREGEEEYERLKEAFNRGDTSYTFCGNRRFMFDM